MHSSHTHMSILEGKTSLIGCRVVRGPDWKWGEQDGGEGHAGTIIDTSSSIDPDRFGKRTINVIWDSGIKSQYRGGPQGSYDLRIIDNAAVAGLHPNVFCDECDNSVEPYEIRGYRWQCATCNTNFCTTCFLKGTPHNMDHNLFKRYDHSMITDPPTVHCWKEGEGPGSRTKLLGAYPGAKVYRVSQTLDRQLPNDGQLNDENYGVVVPYSNIDQYSCIRINWLVKKNLGEPLYGELDLKQANFRALEVSCGGYYCVEAIPVARSIVVDDVDLVATCPAFCIGDVVKYDLSLVDDSENYGFLEKFSEMSGTVKTVSDSFVQVQYNQQELVDFLPIHLMKLNSFSVGDIIKIKTDSVTVDEIAIKGLDKLLESVGRVTGVDVQRPRRLYVEFDSGIKSFDWLSYERSLPSSWMDHLKSAQTKSNDKLVRSEANLVVDMFEAVASGDLRVAKQLHIRHRIDVDVQNPEGLTPLIVAIRKGHTHIVDWLVNEVRVDVERADGRGFRAIHHATIECNLDILQLLIERGAQLDCQTDCGTTAFYIAVSRQLTDCLRLLILGGCDVNKQDSDNNTPFHHAVSFRTTPTVIFKMLFSSGRIDPTLSNNDGRNVLHVAVAYGNINAIQFLLDNMSAQLLETKDLSGKTPFLIACCRKDYVIMDLLLKAGAKVRVRDNEGNGAVNLAAIRLDENDAPPKDPSPKISEMVKKPPFVPSLFIIGYLLDIGCNWDGEQGPSKRPASQILVDKGFDKDVNEVFHQFALKKTIGARRALGKKSCMGGLYCFAQPTLQLSCSHMKPFLVCSQCVVDTLTAARCGCSEERVLSFPSVSSKPVEESTGTDGSLIIKDSEANISSVSEDSNILVEKQNQSVMDGENQVVKRKADCVLDEGNLKAPSPKRKKSFSGPSGTP